jgi:hypothetical protein
MIRCPHCGDLLGPNDFAPGKATLCPRCGGKVVAPSQGAAPPPPSSPSAPTDDDDDTPESELTLRDRLGRLPLGLLAALLLGSLALLFASLPPLSFLVKPLALVGLALAVLVGVVPAARKGKQLRIPIAVAVLSLFVVLFVGSWPASPAPPPPLVAVSLRDRGMVAHKPLTETDWADASAYAVKKNDLRVQIVAVRVGGVEMEQQGRKIVSTEKYLSIQLRVSYDGVDFQQIAYEPWADLVNSPSKNAPTLRDGGEQVLAQKTFAADRKIVGRSERAYLSPGRQVNEVLIYPPPASKTERLRLQLPAVAFGAAGEFRFEIPRSMIEGLP